MRESRRGSAISIFSDAGQYESLTGLGFEGSENSPDVFPGKCEKNMSSDV